MTAVLLTGMSGVGKSTVLRELAARGIQTVDTDYGDWIQEIDGERLWREDAIGSLLATEPEIVVAGTVANQGTFSDRFDAVVLLTIPIEVALQRIAARTTNDWGKQPAERAAIERDYVDVEPLLRAGATHVLDGRRPVAEITEAIVALLRPA